MFAWSTGGVGADNLTTKHWVKFDPAEMRQILATLRTIYRFADCRPVSAPAMFAAQSAFQSLLMLRTIARMENSEECENLQVETIEPVPAVGAPATEPPERSDDSWREILDDGFWHDFDAWATSSGIPKTLQGHERYLVAIGFALHWCARVAMHLEMERRNAERSEGEALQQTPIDPPGKDVVGADGAWFQMNETDSATVVMRSADMLLTCHQGRQYTMASGELFRALAGVCNVLSMAIANRAKRQSK